MCLITSFIGFFVWAAADLHVPPLDEPVSHSLQHAFVVVVGRRTRTALGLSLFSQFFYLVTGVGAGLIYVLAMAAHAAIFNSVTPAWTIPVVGASGAIFGLMLAYGLIFGERVVYFMMLFPMRAKYFTMILGAVEVVTLMNNGVGGDVANLAHVGGLLSGFLFLRTYTALQQRKWRKGGGGGGGAKARGRGLKLVVNNDNKKDDGGPNSGGDGNGPKYWN